MNAEVEGKDRRSTRRDPVEHFSRTWLSNASSWSTTWTLPCRRCEVLRTFRTQRPDSPVAKPRGGGRLKEIPVLSEMPPLHDILTGFDVAVGTSRPESRVAAEHRLPATGELQRRLRHGSSAKKASSCQG